MQVTKDSVDEGIHALATRKLRLDAAVLDGITATGDTRKGKSGDSAADTVQVCLRLTNLLQHYSFCPCSALLAPCGLRLHSMFSWHSINAKDGR